MTRMSTPLALILNVLIGNTEESFDHERALRTLQLQAWLLGTEGRQQEFGRAALVFAAAQSSTYMARMEFKRRGNTPTDLFLRAFASEALENIIDECFDEPEPLYHLLRMSPVWLRQSSYDKMRKDVDDLNELTAIRLRPNETQRALKFSHAVKLYNKIGPSLSESTKIGESQIWENLNKRRENDRDVFLFAAARVAPQLLQMEFDPAKPNYVVAAEKLLGQLGKRSKRTEPFRALCCAAKAIASALDSQRLLSDLTRVWSKIPMKMPKLEPLPSNLIEPKIKRHATEKKTAGRQPTTLGRK
jgi:hypothetical protein